MQPIPSGNDTSDVTPALHLSEVPLVTPAGATLLVVPTETPATEGAITEPTATDAAAAPAPAAKPRAPWVTRVGFGAIALSFVFFGLFFVVPFLPFATPIKGVLLLVCWIGSESSFALGGVILGAQVVRRYRRFFNPVNWFRRAG